MTREEIKNLILRRAYAGVFEELKYSFNLLEFADQNGIDRELIWKIFDELTANSLFKFAYSGGMVEPTPSGLLYCEENDIADPEMIQKQKDIRIKLLATLADMQEQPQYGGKVPWEAWIREAGVSQQDYINNDGLLKYLGLVYDLSPRGYKLTSAGMDKVLDYRNRKRRLDEFGKLENLEGVTAQQRGHNFEDLIGEIIESEGWEVNKRVRAQGEENDIIINKDMNYYFISCKWEKKPIQPEELQLMYARALSRRDVRGAIVVSMSGFTDSCINEIFAKMDTCHVIIFGPKDVTAILSNEKTFSGLLKDKYNEVMLHRRILIDGDIRGVMPDSKKE